MKVTIKDVAKAANVSVATASMALNDKKGVSKKTKELVRLTARSLNYVPNQSARSLVTNESSCIGVLIPDITNPFYSEIVDILSKEIDKKGYTMLLGITNNKSSLEKDYINMFLFRRVAGVVIAPVLGDNPDTRHLEMLRDSNVPFIFCTERYPGREELVVMSDLIGGQYEMTSYLLAKGISKICFLTSEYRADFTRLRMEGFLNAFRDRGLEVDKNLIFQVEYPGFDQAYDMTEAMIKKRPQAILVINDIMAMGVLKKLRERKIRVPEDIWVTGFDDMKFAEIAQTPITTVKQPLPEICEKTMELLFEMVAKKEITFRKEMVTIPTTLVIRETTN